MQKVVNASQMKTIDQYTICTIGIPSMVLMERAALAVATHVEKRVGKKERILAICGTGNNGADGVAVARILTLQGYHTDILIIGDIEKGSNEAKSQIDICKRIGISVFQYSFNNIDINEYTIIIDAIFGIGLNKPLMGQYEDIINKINSGKHTIFSVDIPSGLSAETAKPLNVAVHANYTITFGYNKIGLIMYPGCDYAGDVVVADIGFPSIAESKAGLNHFIYDSTDILRLPARKNDSNKGDYGKVLVIAGSVNMSGACYLSAKAAYRIGTGLVKVITPNDNRVIMQTTLPEAILSTYDGDELLDSFMISKIKEDVSWASSIVIGPGLGTTKMAEEILDLVLQSAFVPIIIDADGLNILAKKIQNNIQMDKEKDPLQILKEILPKNTILTPHLKELSRILNMDIDKIKSNLLETANLCAIDNELIFVMKDARTIVAHNNMRYINVSGNNGMSTGGSGDVLTGIIAGLIAQGHDPQSASTLGVYIHGLAGDIVAKEKGTYALMASDLIEALAKI